MQWVGSMMTGTVRKRPAIAQLRNNTDMQKRNKKAMGSAQCAAATASSAQSTQINMQYTKCRNRQRHGWAAEDANAMANRLKGKRVDQVDRDNSANGADRIVNGVKIQTKYCKTASESVGAAFNNETGTYRYEGMKFEDSKDQYEDAVKIMTEKIRQGKVPGVSNPDAARSMVRKGSVNYRHPRFIGLNVVSIHHQVTYSVIERPQQVSDILEPVAHGDRWNVHPETLHHLYLPVERKTANYGIADMSGDVSVDKDKRWQY